MDINICFHRSNWSLLSGKANLGRKNKVGPFKGGNNNLQRQPLTLKPTLKDVCPQLIDKGDRIIHQAGLYYVAALVDSFPSETPF